MMSSKKLLAFAAIASLALSGCVSTQDTVGYSNPDAGFSTVTANASTAIGKNTVWIQNQEQAEEVASRVHAMVHKKTINADTAVQIALLNNKGLQAAYAELGMNAAEVWQQTLPENPKASIGILGIAHPELGVFRAIEGMIVANILSLATRDKRVGIADTRFRQAQLKAALATLTLAAQTRRAWINSVSAFETVYYLNQGKVAADAASELAKRLGESGALSKSGQAREHAFYAELTGQKAEARLAAKLGQGRAYAPDGVMGL